VTAQVSKPVTLYTNQGHGFDITDSNNTIEPSKSSYATPRYLESYRQLRTKLGVLQFIWCASEPLQSKFATTWKLLVPESGVIAVLASHSWNKIIGVKGLPRSVHDDWYERAKRLSPNDDHERQRIYDQFESEYFCHESPAQLWGRLLLRGVQEHTTSDRVQFLVKHPVLKEWIPQ